MARDIQGIIGLLARFDLLPADVREVFHMGQHRIHLLLLMTKSLLPSISSGSFTG
jgi:hypothetical protein